MEGNDKGMKERLIAAGEKAEAQKAARRERAVRGSHLTQTLLNRAQDAGLILTEKSGFMKVTREGKKGKSVYVLKKGGRVDLSGFTVELEAVRQITESEAQDKHLGKVRGQLDFSRPDDDVLAAYDAALQRLLTD